MTKHLYRSRTHRVVGGVCGGLGEYFDLDPVLVRILTVLLFMLPGVGILTYIIAWIIIPERDYGEEEIESKRNLSPWNNYLPGLLLIGFGCALLARTYFFYFDWSGFWSVALILGGAGLIVYSMKRKAFGDLPEPDQDQTNGLNGHNGGTL